MSSKHSIAVLFILAGIFGSCKDDAVSPPLKQTVIVTGPKSGLAYSTYTFKASINFTPTAGLRYKWLFDSITTSGDSVHWSFATVGPHLIQVEAVNSNGNAYCTSKDTFTVLIAPSLKITPDSSVAETGKMALFQVMPFAFEMPQSYTVNWTVDFAKYVVQSKDTFSCAFSSAGLHTLSAVVVDSFGRSIAMGYAKVWDTDQHIQPINPGDTSSHDFVWTEYTNVQGETNMTGCWVFGSNNIWTVNGDLHHFDGGAWTRIIVKNYESALSGYSIFGFSDNDMWLTHAGLALHYIGSGTVTRFDLTTYSHSLAWMHSAWGLSSSDMYFVGDSGTILHFDGHWTKMTTPTTKNLYSVWGSSDHDVWAAGYDTQTGESELLHFDGQSWVRDALSTSGGIDQWGIGSVWACDSEKHSFVAVSGTSVLRQTDASGWRNDSIVSLSDHIGMYLTGNTSNDFFAIGSFGLVLHWNGRSWQRYDQFLAESSLGYFPHQTSMRENAVCLVGTKNGTSWVLIGQRK